MLARTMVHILPFLPARFIWQFSKRYIAGESLDQALAVSETVQREGARVTIDILGEYNPDPEMAERYRRQYLDIFDLLERRKISGNGSLKPTMFGLLHNPESCYDHIRTIVQKAFQKNSFVRLDMEDSRCTDLEIDLFLRLHKEFPRHTGIVLQSYLLRSHTDLKNLTAAAAHPQHLNIRICKGIYNEPPDIAHADGAEINRQYATMLDFMLAEGIYAAIATHDTDLIDHALKRIRQYRIAADRYEFQMLLGVRPEIGRRLVGNGHPLRIYVPYGPDWLPYSLRRLKENPRMMTHILKSFLPVGSG